MRPTRYIKTAYKTVYWRYGMFFILTAVAVGIVVPWNDKNVQAILSGTSSSSGGSGSPFVIAMRNMKVQGLPHLVNALLITSIFSAGNTYSFGATRVLYGLALEGRAPGFFKKTTRNGVPIFCYMVIICFSCLSFLQLSSSSSQVLNWFTELVTAGALIDYLVMCITFVNFYRACKVQGVDRRSFPYYGYLQPYCAYVGIFVMTVVIIFYGYKSFDPWDVATFFQNYTMQIVAPILYIGWKLIKRTKPVSPAELDLVWERPAIDAYEAALIDPPSSFWREMYDTFSLRWIWGKRHNVM